MLSTITTVSIFTEIFSGGILLSGAITFIRDFLQTKKTKNLYFGLLLLSLFIYVGAGLASQLMFNQGRSLAELIQIQKIVYGCLVFAAIFTWLFIVEKFELKRLRLLSYLIFALLIYLIYLIVNSEVNLVYREGVIEPIVNFYPLIPIKPFFALMWLILTLSSFGSSFTHAGGKRRLLQFTAFSALIFLGSLFSEYLYIRSADGSYLLASWIMMLFSTLGLLLGELVDPESPEALSPLRFLRTRILFKLMLIFVLLIVILFEATTLATINLSKRTLSRSIQNSYLRVVEELASKLNSLPAPPNFETLQSMILQNSAGDMGTVFIVNNQGKLVSHPDRKRALQRENLWQNEAVKRLITGHSGAGEFRDELGEMMVGAYLPIPKYGWGIVIEEPMASAYYDMRSLETNSLIFIIAGIILTVLVGIFFARSIERPIKQLTLGTEAVARGELGYHIAISATDEIGKLAVAFNQMTKDLRDSQERLILSEKLASLGTMAAGMAHEIKNPLVSLRTFTQLLTQKWEDQEFREKFATIIPHEIERINRIAESLLKFGRPMKPELTKVDVNSLLDEVLMLFESEAKKNNVHITKKLAELPEISGDPGQISQAFVNIVKNGIESMHDKGGELIVKTDVGEVIKLGKMQRQGTRVGEEMVWGEEEEAIKPIPVVFIEISDSGEGITEENLKSLFDPFFTTKMTGTGMGLPITLRIIEEHKGSIKVRSKPGKGTTFIITLPQKP
jgi:signal transduction histidine kinase